MKENKVLLYVDWLIDSGNFDKEIREMRKKAGIPLNGIKKELLYKSPTNKDTCIPPELAQKAMPLILNFLERHGLDPFWIIDVQNYLYFNDEVRKLRTNQELVYITEIDDLNNRDLKLYKSTPVCLLLSAYASQRDIIDYIKRTYTSHIKPLQDEYKQEGVKLGRLKNKKSFVKERNDFIYKHKDLPRKEIVSLLYDKYGPKIEMDVGYVGKIISTENKKRKKV